MPLMVHHEVTSIPSASTLAVLRRELHGRAPAEKVVAVFADPVFDKADERVTGDLEPQRGRAPRSAAADAASDVQAQSSDGARLYRDFLIRDKRQRRSWPSLLQQAERLRSALKLIVRRR